jgi:hypothetical protein
MKQFKISLSWQRNQFFVPLLVLLIASSIGVFIYIESQKSQTCKSSPQLTYWPIALKAWNKTDNLRTMKRVFDRLGHRMVNGSEEAWDIMWSLEFPFDHFPEKLVNVAPHQRINHFPGMTFLTNKMFLAISTNSKYVPVAFELPRLKNEFLYYYKMNSSKRFVVKNFDNRGVKIVKYESIDFQLGEERRVSSSTYLLNLEDNFLNSSQISSTVH